MKANSEFDPVVAQFLRDLNGVPWFKNLGQPLLPDTDARQLHRWEDWPGPEESGIAELSERQQALHDELLASAPERREDLEKLWEQIHEIVFSRATTCVPYDVNKDSWHGPSTAVWQASWTAGLVAWCLLLRRNIPADLQEQWRWFLLGHWPAGYTIALADDQLSPLLVF